MKVPSCVPSPTVFTMDTLQLSGRQSCDLTFSTQPTESTSRHFALHFKLKEFGSLFWEYWAFVKYPLFVWLFIFRSWGFIFKSKSCKQGMYIQITSMCIQIIKVLSVHPRSLPLGWSCTICQVVMRGGVKVLTWQKKYYSNSSLNFH